MLEDTGTPSISTSWNKSSSKVLLKDRNTSLAPLLVLTGPQKEHIRNYFDCCVYVIYIIYIHCIFINCKIFNLHIHIYIYIYYFYYYYYYYYYWLLLWLFIFFNYYSSYYYFFDYYYIYIYINLCAYTVTIATIDQSTPRLLAPAPIRYLAVSILCFTFSFRSPYQNNVLRSEDTGLIGFAWKYGVSICLKIWWFSTILPHGNRHLRFYCSFANSPWKKIGIINDQWQSPGWLCIYVILYQYLIILPIESIYFHHIPSEF